MAELVWDGGAGERTISVPDSGGVIGRSPSADLCVPHPSISRRHARLEPAVDGRWRITDLGSRNGLIVRSRRTHETHLEAGDPIQLGDVALRLEVPPPAENQTSPDEAALPEELAHLLDPDDRDLAEPTPPAIESSGTPQLPSAEDLSREALVFGEVISESGEAGRTVSRELDFAAPGAEFGTPPSAGTPAHLTPAEDRSSPTASDRSPRRLLLAVGTGIALVIAVLLLHGDSEHRSGERTADERSGGENGAGENGGDHRPITVGASSAEHASPTEGTPPGEGATTVSSAPLRQADRAGTPLTADALLANLLTLEPKQVERAWSASALLFGRAPTPAETWLHADGGLEAFIAGARRSAEHWRHRAESTLGTSELPGALLPDEVPLEVAAWGRVLREAHLERTRESRTRDARRREGGADPVVDDDRAGVARSDLPLPSPEGDDSAYLAAVAARLEEGPVPIVGRRALLRSLWSAGAGRPFDLESARAIEELSRSDLPGDTLVTRLLGRWSAAHPLVNARTAIALDERQWERLMPPRTPRSDGEAPPAGHATATASWTDSWLDLGVTPAQWWAIAVASRLPRSPAEPTGVGPLGTLRVELLAPFAVVPLLESPEQVPRLWRRLAASRLLIGKGTAEDPLSRFTRSAISGGEAILVRVASAEPTPLSAALPLDRARERIADGTLLPALDLLTERLGLRGAIDAPTAEVAAWLDAVAQPRTRGGERLFLAGGYRYVPGEWRASAYRPATRAILCGGAQLLETPGTDVVVRAVLTEMPSDGVAGEWAEWMSALELVAKGCPEHSFSLWIHGRGPGDEGRAVAIEWGPQVGRGWVERLDSAIDIVHPILAAQVPDATEEGIELPAATGKAAESTEAEGRDR